jgi:hypothetical protein
MDKKRLSRWKSTHVLNSLSLPSFLREINIRRIVSNGLFILHDGSADACPHALTLGIHASVNDWWDAMLPEATIHHLKCLKGAEQKNFSKSTHDVY